MAAPVVSGPESSGSGSAALTGSHIRSGGILPVRPLEPGVPDAMAAKNKPYEQFGRYILFKKLESSALGELWRAGRIDDDRIGATVALRRLNGAAKESIAASLASAKQIVPLLSGTSFAKDQVIDVIDGVPFIAYDYSGGRSLRHIVDRARGDTGVSPNPIPIDQAIVIAEKVALSLATTEELKARDKRLAHAGLIPQFVWITDEGEIRVAGQQLGKGIVPALRDAKLGAEVGRYFAPEYQVSGEPTKGSEVYSLGALLFLLVTGQEPPDPLNASAFSQAVRAAKTNLNEPVPDDIRAILDRSLAVDAQQRYASVGEMKAELSRLAHDGRYSATTFNLAFYLSSLLRKEMEGEAIDREREGRLSVAAYLEPEPAAAPAPERGVPVAAASAPFSSSPLSIPEQKTRSKAPLAIAAVIVLAAIGGGAFMMMSGKSATPANDAGTSSVPQAPKVVSKPIEVTPPGTAGTPAPTDSATTSADPAAQTAAFEKAVDQRMQEEMMKLQSQYNQQLQQQGSKLAPVATAPVPKVAASEAERSPSAAQLDQQRLQTREQAPATPAQAAPATATQAAIPQPAAAQPAAAAVSTVAEGDVVDITALDTMPQLVRPIRPEYPPMAARQRVEGTVIVTALVSEKGDVIDVKVLGGERRMGLDAAAARAMRAAKFSPAMKDGKRVKTWFPQRINFKL